MNKAFIALIIFIGLLLALNIHSVGLLGLFVGLFIIKAAFSVVLHKNPISHFIRMLLALIIGPVIVCCVIRMLLASLRGQWGAGSGSLATALLLLFLMTVSFLYVRHQILGRSKHEAKELQTNERRPLLPPHTDEERIEHHAWD